MREKTKAVTKTVKKYGNSGGVYVPSAWVGGEVEVRLISRPPAPERDILLAFSRQMKHIVSAFIYGSYARKEQAGESDIDVIIVTDEHVKDIKTPESLKGMNYDIRAMSSKEIRKALERDALFRKTLEDIKPLLNESFLEELKSIKTSTKNLKERIDFARSSLEITKSIFRAGSRGADLIYPLVMRIKEMLIVECILENKRYSFRLLEESIKERGIKRSGFTRLMEHYRAVRGDRKLPVFYFDEDIFRRLIELLEEKIRYVEKKEAGKKGN